MIEYSYPLFRPPAEANSIILQVTHGCSYNNCSFCSMYKSKNYKARDLKDIFQDIETLSNYHPDANKIFLADGDALSLPTPQLLCILEKLQKSFARLRRVSTYASAQNILNKSKDDLETLAKNRLNLFYYGIETGSDLVLKKITKGVNKAEIISSLNRASDAGVKISATVILGMGGTKHSNEHIEQSADVVNATTINYLSTLQLGLEDDVKENFYKHFNDFTMPDDFQILNEQRKFIQLLNQKNKIIFRSNHASNALHLAGTLPKDKERLLHELDVALHIGNTALVPHEFRSF